MYKGKLVQLVAMTEEHRKKGIKMLNDYELRKKFDSISVYPFTEEDADSFFGIQSAYKDKYRFAIETLDGEYLGHCGTNYHGNKNKVTYIGIAIANKDYQGKGYGTEAIHLLLDILFGEMNYNKVGLRVFAFNERAIKCYEKVGFKKEGILREELYSGDKYHDVIVMGILKKEWRKRGKTDG